MGPKAPDPVLGLMDGNTKTMEELCFTELESRTGRLPVVFAYFGEFLGSFPWGGDIPILSGNVLIETIRIT